MKLYLAGMEQRTNLKPYFESGELTTDFNALISFYYVQKGCKWLNQWIKNDRFRTTMIDSGAFSYMNSGQSPKSINWEKYVEQYTDYINTVSPDHYIELDIENIVGLDRVEQMRAKLGRLTGKDPIPVWHPERGIDYWKKMCKNYDYVAIGGMAQDSRRKYRNKLEKKFPWFIRVAHKNNAKVHGLGYASFEGLEKYNFDSTDVTSYLSPKYGEVYYFDGKKPVKTDKDERVKTGPKPYVQSVKAWLKYMRRLENI